MVQKYDSTQTTYIGLDGKTHTAFLYSYFINGTEYKLFNVINGQLNLLQPVINIQTTAVGEDIFGNRTDTITDTVYKIIQGKLVTQSSHSVTTGTDILGNATKNISDVTYT